jgi:hypothetical protein
MSDGAATERVSSSGTPEMTIFNAENLVAAGTTSYLLKVTGDVVKEALRQRGETKREAMRQIGATARKAIKEAIDDYKDERRNR